VLEWYRSLIALRRSVPELTDGRPDGVRTAFDEAAGWLRMARGPIEVVANLGRAPVRLPAAGAVVLRSEAAVALEAGEIVLPPDAVAVLRA
jgi:maltooligosyltrehalose trehalohydrolase